LRPFATLLEALIDSPSYEHATPQLLITQDAHYISEQVVRGLAQSRDRGHRAARLNVLDLLLELGVYGIGDAIAASERL
jgi:hypothetical protein